MSDELEDDEPCECGAADCEIARAIFDDAIAKLPEKVTLFYLSQGDQLQDEQVNEIFAGSYDAVSEQIYDWFRDNDHWAIDYEIEAILDSDEIDVLKEHPSNEMPDHWTLHDELRDAIRDRDDSDPMGELTRATPDVMLRLDTREVIEESDTSEELIEIVCRGLGLSPMVNRARIMKWLAENFNEVYGSVEIVWRADIQEAVDQFKPWEQGEQIGTVAVFKDPWIDVGSASLLQLSGEAAVLLTPVNELPRIETEICRNPEYAASPQVMSEFDRYRDGLLAFHEYRNKILETSPR